MIQMEILKYIFMGMLISHIFCFLVTLMTDDEELSIISGSFLITGPFCLIKSIIKNIRISYIRKVYVPFALYAVYDFKDEQKNSIKRNPVSLGVFRIKAKYIKKYRDKTYPYIEEMEGIDDTVCFYYMEQINGKYVENAENIMKKNKKEEKFNQNWVNKHLRVLN